jgi:hypothetical protein
MAIKFDPSKAFSFQNQSREPEQSIPGVSTHMSLLPPSPKHQQGADHESPINVISNGQKPNIGEEGESKEIAKGDFSNSLTASFPSNPNTNSSPALAPRSQLHNTMESIEGGKGGPSAGNQVNSEANWKKDEYPFTSPNAYKNLLSQEPHKTDYDGIYPQVPKSGFTSPKQYPQVVYPQTVQSQQDGYNPGGSLNTKGNYAFNQGISPYSVGRPNHQLPIQPPATYPQTATKPGSRNVFAQRDFPITQTLKIQQNKSSLQRQPSRHQSAKKMERFGPQVMQKHTRRTLGVTPARLKTGILIQPTVPRFQEHKDPTDLNELRMERDQLAAKVEQLKLLVQSKPLSSSPNTPRFLGIVDTVSYQFHKSEHSQNQNMRDTWQINNQNPVKKEISTSGNLQTPRMLEGGPKSAALILGRHEFDRSKSFGGSPGRKDQPNEVKFLNGSIAVLQNEIDTLSRQMQIADTERLNAEVNYKRACNEIKSLRTDVSIAINEITTQKLITAALTDLVLREGDEHLQDEMGKLMSQKQN